MERIRKLPTSKRHYLVEMKHAENAWSWDIYINATDTEEIKGSAKAPGKGVEVPWTKLASQDFLGEMMQICQERMLKHSS